MENLINELYYGNICPVEQMGGATSEEKEILKRIHENEERLRATLDEQENAILDAIKDDYFNLANSMGERRFQKAFSLGARLMMEILTGDINNSSRTIICGV